MKNIFSTYEKIYGARKTIWCPGMNNILAALIDSKCIALVEAHDMYKFRGC